MDGRRNPRADNAQNGRAGESAVVKRDTRAMRASPRCGAKTRRGTPCQAPAVKGKKRCRMHGGAPGSGAPKGNKNALKHGYYTAEAIALRRQLRAFLHEMEKSVRAFEDD
jgi:glucans biosynthesis protein